jgi:hypothetical protein
LAEWLEVVDEYSAHCLIDGVLVSRSLLKAQIDSGRARLRRRWRGHGGSGSGDS